MKNLIFSLFLSLFFISSSFAFSIEEVHISEVSEKRYLLFFYLKDFPLQEVILALKRQKEEVLLLCEIELYRKNLFFRAERLERYVFFKKAGYDPLRNQYYLEDEKIRIFFNHPEDLTNLLTKFESLLLSFPNLAGSEDYYLLIKVQLKFYTHLDAKLRYTSKIREVVYKTEKTYDLQKKLLY
ncbi:MAG: hypothetical protein ACP5QC_05140 [Caldimicrobium sp.]